MTSPRPSGWHRKGPGAASRRRGASGWKWARLRVAVLERDGHRCWVCGGMANQVDHVRPLALGGDDSPSNLRAVCSACNKLRLYAQRRRSPQTTPSAPAVRPATNWYGTSGVRPGWR